MVRPERLKQLMISDLGQSDRTQLAQYMNQGHTEMNQVSPTAWVDFENSDMHSRLAAFNNAEPYLPTVSQQIPGTTLTELKPRYVPERESPWSPLKVKASSPQSDQLIYDFDEGRCTTGSNHVPTSYMYNYSTQWGSHAAESPKGGNKLDQGSHTEHLPDAAQPGETIDPPASPDPVGPPPNRATRNGNLCRRSSGGSRLRGRRRGPMQTQNRLDAQKRRSTGGSCWSCTFRRDKVLRAAYFWLFATRSLTS